MKLVITLFLTQHFLSFFVFVLSGFLFVATYFRSSCWVWEGHKCLFDRFHVFTQPALHSNLLCYQRLQLFNLLLIVKYLFCCIFVDFSSVRVNYILIAVFHLVLFISYFSYSFFLCSQIPFSRVLAFLVGALHQAGETVPTQQDCCFSESPASFSSPQLFFFFLS